MSIKIDQSVFDKYFEIIDSTIDDYFGVDCILVWVEKVEVIDNSFDNIPDGRSVNPHRRPKGPHKRNNKTFKEVEKTDKIKMKVYWSEKEWINPGGNIVIPDNSVQTVFKFDNLSKVQRAKEVIIHDAIDELKELRYQMAVDPFPVAFKKQRYWACFWSKV